MRTVYKAENPLLIMKTGVLCAEPAGFTEQLAEELDARIYSLSQVRREWAPQSDERKLRPAQKHAVQTELEGRIADALERGRNVVYGSLLNNAEKRHRIRGIAHGAGAVAVSLSIITPMELVYRRIEEKQASEIDDAEQAMLAAANDKLVADEMARSLRHNWPHRKGESTLGLDGEKTPDELVRQVLGDLVGNNLIHPVRDTAVND
jgi:predicted kinase